jgi:hypothetical protein
MFDNDDGIWYGESTDSTAVFLFISLREMDSILVPLQTA